MASPPQHDAATPSSAGWGRAGHNRPVTGGEGQERASKPSTGSGRQKWGMTLKHEHEKGEDGGIQLRFEGQEVRRGDRAWSFQRAWYVARRRSHTTAYA